MEDLKPIVSEASRELASAMNDLDEANGIFFKAFQAAVPALSRLEHPAIIVLLGCWEDWTEKRRRRDRLRARISSSNSNTAQHHP